LALKLIGVFYEVLNTMGTTYKIFH